MESACSGTEIKAARSGQVSLQEGYVRATETTAGVDACIACTLRSMRRPVRSSMHRRVPAGCWRHKREIRKLAMATREKGVTLVPLKMYFERGRLKVMIGLARGKRKADKRQKLDTKQAKREIDRAMSKRM